MFIYLFIYLLIYLQRINNSVGSQTIPSQMVRRIEWMCKEETAISVHFSRKNEENHKKTSVRIADFWAEIWTRDLKSAKEKYP
jgi:hypothetical protein